ncbi:MAG: hypothetical protein WC212_09165 [Candidatus Delongbacteria bacterium]|jgi:hypothetical protein|nr:hypothetical protein [Candidatus Delongbacteria bacterium]
MKTVKILVFAAAVSALFFMTGCDQFEDFSVNVPFTVAMTDSSYSTTITSSEVYDLDSSSVYQEYKDKIKDFKFLEAKYTVTYAEPADLSGKIRLTMKKNSSAGEVLFVKEYDYSQADFDQSFTVVMTQEEISLFNLFLASAGTKIFYGEAYVYDLPDNSDKKKMTVKIHLLLKAEGEL